MSNDQKEPRKATDILISIEEKIYTLMQMVNNYDQNVKIILDRVNKIYAYVEGANKTELPETAPIKAEEIIQSPTSEQIIPIEENPVGIRRTSRTETIPQENTEKLIEKSDKKVPVIQRITDNTGKDIFMADVHIMDEKNTIIKTKTNAVGKWQAHLRPGKYKVSVVKTDTVSKKKIEALQEITINDTNTTMVLPSAIIKR